MRHLDEYRDPTAIRHVLDRIARRIRRPWTLMEICGGQTHSILKFGLDQLLPDRLRLVHGPGCPVCVTPLADIDRALAIAAQPNTVLCSYGDMLRVPGSRQDLLVAKARGADVRIVTSPLDAVAIARAEPQRRVVFFAVGFETTAPATAMAVRAAEREGLDNFFVLVSHVLVPPALEMLLAADGGHLDGVLAPGHVCVVSGWRPYEDLSRRFRVPVVITGFEPLDLVHGIERCVALLEAGTIAVENAYERVARADGNAAAQRLVDEVFRVCDRRWRGIGSIAASGLELAPAYSRFDARSVFAIDEAAESDPEDCLAGAVLQGKLKPTDCPQFGTACTPERPLGAPMVSAEGACAAYFHYGRGEGGVA